MFGSFVPLCLCVFVVNLKFRCCANTEQTGKLKPPVLKRALLLVGIEAGRLAGGGG